MAKGTLSTVLQHVQRMAAAAQVSGMGDSELLRRFIDQHDETAFAAVVRRHGGLVFGVCRQVLKHEQDAEDAFQATFLALAQGAASVRRAESLASWLHGTAYRLSMRAKRDIARRRVHERRATPCEPQEGDTEVSWREVLTALHEEIQKLAEKYRSPFVLHYLESKSCPEVAAALGLKEGTVWSRLAKARTLLQGRLSRRGLELTSALAVMVVAWQETAAVPPLLIVTTARVGAQFAASGSAAGATANALSLATGVTKTMMLTKTKIATAVFLAMGAVAVGASLIANPPSTTKEGGEPKQAASVNTFDRLQVRPEGTHIAVKGRVLDPDGKPVAGAKLYLGHYGPNDKVAVSERARSDADGRFQFRFPKSQLSKAQVVWRDPWEDPWDDPLERVKLMQWRGGDRVGQVMAVASGLGCDWVRLDPKAATHELTLWLVKDVPVSGQIVDSEGKPVAGARLRVGNVQAGGDIKETLEALRNKYHKKPGEGQAPRKSKDWRDWLVGDWKEWSGPVPGQGQAVTTGEDGRFRLSGFGSERLVIFQVEGPGIATGYLRVMTRVGDPIVRPEFKGRIPGWTVLENGRLSETVTAPAETVCYGATFRYLAAASRPIRGVVTDKKTGKPAADVEVFAFAEKEDGLPRFLSVPEVPVYARTDREGRYELLGCEKSPVYLWSYNTQDSGRYFPLSKKIKDTAGLKPLTANFEIIPGSTVVRGKVRNERTGKPIPGCRVYYFPLLPNPAINQFRGWAGGAVGHFCSRMMTGADGSFAVAALPGPGVICVSEPVSDSERPSWQRGELGNYARIPITSQEFKDFSTKHNVVLGEGAIGPENSEKNLRCADIGGNYFRSQSMWGNRLFLIHPGEKDEELKRDVALRPKEEGAGKDDSKTNQGP